MGDIFSEFKAADHSEWLKLVEKELKTPLVSYEISEGIFANPFVGNLASSFGSSISKSKVGWTIYQFIEGDSSVEINKNILTALEGGASGISVFIKDLDYDFEIVFKDVILSFIEVRFYFSDEFFSSSLFFQNLESFLEGKDANIVFAGLTKGELQIAKQLGKIEVSSKSEGTLAENLSEVLREAESLTFFEGFELVVALPSQENFYLNIAQHKAVKIIWAQIAEAYNSPEKQISLISKVNFSHQDPNSQVIAATQQTASCVFGGTDAILMQNIPFDTAKYPESFSARITRNIQNVIWNESFLYRVNDPSKGSYFIDDLCEKLINEVWNIFIKDK